MKIETTKAQASMIVTALRCYWQDCMDEAERIEKLLQSRADTGFTPEQARLWRKRGDAAWHLSEVVQRAQERA